MMAKLAVVGIALVACFAVFTTWAGGGADNPAGGRCTMAHDSGCNPDAGVLHLGSQRRCVVLQGTGWSGPGPCADPATPPPARFVDAPAVGDGPLTDDQIRTLWTDAGGNPAKAAMAIAIARAESGGRPDATGHNTDGSIDRGVWQINSIHGAQSTTDPAANARSAVAISANGTDWGPWTTYTTGAYRRFLA